MKRLFWVVVTIIASALPFMWLRPVIENQTWWGAGLGLVLVAASIVAMIVVILETAD